MECGSKLALSVSEFLLDTSRASLHNAHATMVEAVDGAELVCTQFHAFII